MASLQFCAGGWGAVSLLTLSSAGAASLLQSQAKAVQRDSMGGHDSEGIHVVLIKLIKRH
jgi:hypothetical protein